jgi:divalent metal cation (Fe/Co/Zn/Cd) transporter
VSANRDALRVSYATVVWSGVQGAGAVVEGLHTKSLALVGVGVSLALDVGSSCVLIWRFRKTDGHQAAERIAAKVARVSLAVVAVGLIIGAVQRLATGSGPTVSALSIGLAIAGVLVLPVLARWKYRVALRVGSGALRTDAHITAVGAAMSAVTVVGLAVTGLFDWWWADSVAAILVAGLALRQVRNGDGGSASRSITAG